MKFMASFEPTKEGSFDGKPSNRQQIQVRNRKLAVLLLTLCGSLILLVIFGSIFVVQLTSQLNDMRQDVENNRRTTEAIKKRLILNDKDAPLFNETTTEHVLQRSKRSSSRAYFRWSSTDGDLSIHDMMVDIEDSTRGTFLTTKKTGYYFVYAQLTYRGRGAFPIGHETVRITNIDGRSEIVLMQHVNTQTWGSTRLGIANQVSNMDSGYHGGLFYLFKGDKVGVRPSNSGVQNQEFKTNKSNSFFGIFYVAE